MIKYVIPARKNSKGLPFKNRKLISHTLQKFPKEILNNVILTTDDEILLNIGLDYGINCVNRDPNLALDETSTKDVMIDLKNRGVIDNSDTVIMLYLTYPERTWLDINNAIAFFNQNSGKSLLCKKEINSTHPYLYLLDIDGIRGKQLTPHNLYRRQDYPKVFELSHFICIFNVNELENLNNNLYNNETIFYGIDNVIDVDTMDDLEKLKV